MQAQQVSILVPLTVGVCAIVSTIFIHALALVAAVNFVRHERGLGRASTSFLMGVSIVAVAMSFTLAAHLLEIALWAILFMACGEFHEFGPAFDHSAVNYSTLGYGNVVMTPSWRLLGPLEAMDGMLMFGITTGMTFAVIQLLVRTRYADLRE